MYSGVCVYIDIRCTHKQSSFTKLLRRGLTAGASLRTSTSILDVRGFYSSRILISRDGILMPNREFNEFP